MRNSTSQPQIPCKSIISKQIPQIDVREKIAKCDTIIHKDAFHGKKLLKNVRKQVKNSTFSTVLLGLCN